MKWRRYLSLFVRIVHVCVRDGARERPSHFLFLPIFISLIKGFTVISSGIQGDHSRLNGPLITWVKTERMSCHLVTNAFSVYMACAEFVPRQFGGTRVLRGSGVLLLLSMHRKSLIIVLLLISLTCIHPCRVLTYHTCRLYNNRTLF